MNLGTNNPRLYINTRIPNAIGVIGASYSGQNRNLGSLRRATGYGDDYLCIGIDNSISFNKSIFRSGLTPGDNGYLNDGGSYSLSADAPSKFLTPSTPNFYSYKQWWPGIVIYCYDPNDSNPDSGYDGVEIFTIDGQNSQINPIDIITLSSITKSLLGISPYIMQSSFSQNNDYSALFSTSNYFSQNFYLVSDTFYSEFNFNDGEEYIFSVLFNATNFNNPMTIVNRSDINQTDFEITIIDQDHIQVIINNSIIVFTTGGGSPWNAALQPNDWINLKLTFTSNSNTVIVQLKLVFAGQTFIVTIPIQNTNVTSDNLFFIGCQPFNGLSFSPSNFFDGYIDYVTFTKNSPAPAVTIIDLSFDNFSDDKLFTDNTGKVFNIKPDPTFPLNTEYECLSLLTKPEFLCVNTHYPNIIFNKSKFENNLQLLIDFGFIPSYPRGGNLAYDLSGNGTNTMVLNNIIYKNQWAYFNGGHIVFDNITNINNSTPFGKIGSNSNFNDTKNVISIWIAFAITGDDQIIYSCYDQNSNSGYYLHIRGNRIVFTYGTGNGLTVPPIDIEIPIDFYNYNGTFIPGKLVAGDSYNSFSNTVPSYFYNIICKFDTVGGDFIITLSDAWSYGYPGTQQSGGINGSVTYDSSMTPMSPANVPFEIGCEIPGIFNGGAYSVTTLANAHVSLISIYNCDMFDGEMQDLYNAYTNNNRPYSNGFFPTQNRYIPY